MLKVDFKKKSISVGGGQQSAQVMRRPVAPAVYRPQPVPKVLQRQVAAGQMPKVDQAVHPPVAPPIYRPQIKAPVAQRRIAGAPQLRTNAPPVYRPQPVPRVLQTKKSIPVVGSGRQGAIQRSRDTRPIGNVVQRDVDLKTALQTENGRYLIDPRDNTVLYSEVHAVPPKPRGLYRRTIDRTSGSPHKTLYAWTPNVRFLSRAEDSATHSKSKPGFLEYTTEGSLFSSTNRFSLRGLGQELESPPELGKRPTLGVLGKNDCYGFGDALQNMIVMNGQLPLIPLGRTKKNVHVNKPESPGDLRMEVGDMMRHLYKGQQTCNYHAATVVAKDGESLVTLEGHAGKDLSRPEFQIRNGVAGFARREIGLGYGDEVEITPLESLDPEAVAFEREGFERRYRRITGDDVELGFAQAVKNLGITYTDEQQRKRWALRRRREELREWRRQGQDRVRERWDEARKVGSVSINASGEGNSYITDEML